MSGAGGCIEAIPPTNTTTLSLKNPDLFAKALGARRSRFGKPVAHADLEVPLDELNELRSV